MACSRRTKIVDFIKTWQCPISFVGSIIIFGVASYLFSTHNTYVQIAVLLCAVVLFFKGVGISRFAISSHSLDVTLEEVKKVQTYMEDMLPILIPSIVKSTDATGHSKEFGRLDIYDLIQKINNNPNYDCERKRELIRGLKWVLLRWIFHAFHRESLIERLKDDLQIDSINKGLKNTENPWKDFCWLSEQLKKLNNLEIKEKIGSEEYKDFIKTTGFYEKTINTFIEKDFIEPCFLKTGRRPT